MSEQAVHHEVDSSGVCMYCNVVVSDSRADCPQRIKENKPGTEGRSARFDRSKATEGQAKQSKMRPWPTETDHSQPVVPTSKEVVLWKALASALHASGCYRSDCCGGPEGHEKILREVRDIRDQHGELMLKHCETPPPKAEPADAEKLQAEKDDIKRRVHQWACSFLERADAAIDRGVPVSMCDEAGCVEVEAKQGIRQVVPNGSYRITFEIGAFTSPFPTRTMRDVLQQKLEEMAEMKIAELHHLVADLYDHVVHNYVVGQSDAEGKAKLEKAIKTIYEATKPVK